MSQASHRSLEELRPRLSQTPLESPHRPRVPSRASGGTEGTQGSHWSVRSDGSMRSGLTVLSAVARDVLDPAQHPRACCLLCCRSAELTPKVSALLQPHQRAGVRWLFRAHYRGGGILGDEPGLGKTLQAVASVEALVTAQLVSHVLIVVTAEMVANWAVEFKKFSVERSVDLICIQREVASLHATDHLRRLVNVNAPDHSVVIVSYEEILLNTGTICLNTVKYSSF
ncbi:hypothetical protein AB1Y20_022932 [Prymnesium parvum]|uniref:SNF2 N-terminal domain-containing protein n=1 Tax=Prymnesium parvum TaxID=97485 RepID=A0AB34JDI9_PRYPA